MLEWLYGVKETTRPFDSFWPIDAIWRHRSGLTVAQIMAWCLTVPSHYRNHCWLIINGVLWHSLESNFTRDLIRNMCLKNALSKFQTKWDVAVHGRDLYLVKPTLGPPKKFQHLTRAEEVVITRLRIGHTKATKSHILSRGPPPGCHHCGQTLTIDHMLLECALLQECRDEYYTVDSLNALFETIPETCIVEFLREAGFFYLIWCNLLTSTSPQTFTIWSVLSNYLENESNSDTHLLV